MPNVYEIVTEQILSALDRGTVPWRKPWKASDAPRNMDGRKYTGINTFLLLTSAMAGGYTSPYWLTFKKAQALGGSVRKGEKSTIIVFYKKLEVEDEKRDDGKTKTIPMLRYYRVFNAAQCDGIDVPESSDGPEMPEHEPHDVAESIMARYLTSGGPSFTEMGDRAFYSPVMDSITVPPRGSYVEPAAFYETSFHEIGHSTCHGSRLNRSFPNQTGFGSHGYGREELVAEMTAAFLMAEAGIMDRMEQSASYIDNWRRTIKEDTRAVVVAAGAAQKAADYVMGRSASNGASEPQRELQAA